MAGGVRVPAQAGEVVHGESSAKEFGGRLEGSQVIESSFVRPKDRSMCLMCQFKWLGIRDLNPFAASGTIRDRADYGFGDI